MSITFLPTAGTWTTHHYYLSDDDFGVVNGVYATNDEEPQVQCHNSGGMLFVEHFNLVPAGVDINDCFVGEFPAEGINELVKKVEHWSPIGSGLDDWAINYMRADKVQSFMQMLLHCKRHACGFTWG